MDKVVNEGDHTSHEVFLCSLHANQKLVVLKIALLLAILICIVFTVLNLSQENTVLVAILIVESVVYLFLFYLIMRSHDFLKPYGHVAGDECLKNVADAFSNSIRRVTDITARYGGEEFAAILSDTDTDGAKIIAQAIKDAIKGNAIPHNASQAKNMVSMSFGIATVIPNDSLDCESFIEKADKALSE